MKQTARAHYGIDAPAVLVALAIGGLILTGFGWGLWERGHGWGDRVLALLPLAGGIVCAGELLLMLRSSLWGKLQARDQLLDGLQLGGDETVLDVGCGHGLLLIGAARRLPRGRAIGIDLWSNADQARNSRQATLANAEAEGVADRIELHDGDMRQLPLADASCDVVVASLAIHNIPTRAERLRALQEMARVLKPGGRVALLDFQHTREYVDDLAGLGLVDLELSKVSFQLFPPVRVARGRKPSTPASA